MKKILILMIMCTLLCTSCKEYYSEGERVGTVTKFSKAGIVWDSWDGHLNLTQTGMNSAGEPFVFSFDNDRTDQGELINLVSEAQRCGWKIKVIYHETWGFKNFFWNRGESDYFVDGVTILDTNFAKPLGNFNQKLDTAKNIGTKENPFYVVIVKE